MSRILLILTCTATRPRDQTVEFNEMVSSLGHATEKESRARYCSTLITAGTNAIDELVFGVYNKRVTGELVKVSAYISMRSSFPSLLAMSPAHRTVRRLVSASASSSDWYTSKVYLFEHATHRLIMHEACKS